MSLDAVNDAAMFNNKTGRMSEYKYTTDEDGFSHGYLVGPVREIARRAPHGAALLDVGSGNGTMSKAIRADRPDLRVFGAELSRSGVEFASRNPRGVTFRVGSAYDSYNELFPEVDLFDVILSTEVVEHLYEPRRFVERAAEALRPSGTLIVTTPYHGYLKNLALAASGHLDAHFTALWDGGHIKFWSKKTLTELLEEKHQFRVEQFSGVGRVPGLWKSMVLVARRL